MIILERRIPENSMAHQTNIRAVIELLCSFYKKLGFSKITPELFRQAKFNSSEAIRPFWTLLYEVLWYVTYGEIPDKGQRIEDVKVFVKAVFQDLGYRSKEFFSSSHTGSRELIIAFGWLAGRYKICDLLVDMVEISYCNCIMRKCKEDIVTQDEITALDLGESLDYLLASFNRSSMEWKNLRQLFQFVVKKVMNSDFHLQAVKDSIQPIFSNATFLDIITIFDSGKNQEHTIKTLEGHQRLLSVYLKWIKNEEVFWKWMASVVDTDKVNSSSKEHPGSAVSIQSGIAANREDSQEHIPGRVNCIFSSEISELSRLVSKLTHLLLMVNWTRRDYKSRRSSHYDASRPTSSIDEIGKLNENLQCFITDVESKLMLLEEELRKCVSLDDDETMQDIIHLPPPRK